MNNLIDPETALNLVTAAAAELPPRVCSLADALGLRLAQAVVADRDCPPFHRSLMDGYAVRTSDAGRTITVVGEIPAGVPVSEEVVAGGCFEIMTGAACPAGTEAVVPKEFVERNGDRVNLPADIRAGQFVAPRASDCARGHEVLSAGQPVTPLAVAAISAFGLESVRVVPRPTLAVVTTGSELVGRGESLGPTQIRNSNGPMLAAMAREMGIRDIQMGAAADDLATITAALHAASDRDLIVLTGGVSMGNYDLVPQAVSEYGGETILHKVTQRPGKPMLVARRQTQLIFGLPGNPLSCHLCFHRYVSAAVRKMSGDPIDGPRTIGHLAVPFRPDTARHFFVTCRAKPCEDGPTPWAIHPLMAASSADVFSSAAADCYAEIPRGAAELPPGEKVAISWMNGAADRLASFRPLHLL